MNYGTFPPRLRHAALAIFPLLGCVRPDPDHCANLQGDNTCAELGAGDYCSACKGSNNGCVPSKPPPQTACYAPGDEPFGGSSDGSSTGTAGESTAGASTGPECTAQGLDEACPDQQPYCVEGACTSCADNAETFCADLDPAAPECAAGRCVSCTSDPSVCEESTWCNEGTFACGGCTEHAQCPDSACEIETGECMPTDRVYFVDNAVCPPSQQPQGVGRGSEQDPFCRILDAVNAVDSNEKATVVIQGGGLAYTRGITQASPPLRVIAYLGRDRPRISEEDDSEIDVRATNTVYLHDLELRSGAIGIECRENSKVWGSEIELVSNVVGIDATKCTVDLSRSIVRTGRGTGVLLQDASFLRMRASGIRGNGGTMANTSALHSIDSGFDIRYSTIVGNNMVAKKGDQPLASMRCVGGVRVGSIVRNSIIAGEELDSSICPGLDIQTSMVDTASLASGDNTLLRIFSEDWWGANHAVTLSSPTPPIFDGLGVWAIGDPAFDFDGPVARSPGDATYVGADEP